MENTAAQGSSARVHKGAQGNKEADFYIQEDEKHILYLDRVDRWQNLQSNNHPVKVSRLSTLPRVM